MPKCIICGSKIGVESLMKYQICENCINEIFDKCNIKENTERLNKELNLAINMYNKRKLSPKDLSFILTKTVSNQVFNEEIKKHINNEKCG